jgi:uncharacterized protein with HEPN domain
MIGIQQISAWLNSHDIPNWVTLTIEVPFGVIITVIVYRLQSKTSKFSEAVIMKINEATQKIDSYIKEKKKLEVTTKKFHVDRVIRNLEYIKQQDERAKNVILEFKRTGKVPDMDYRLGIIMQYHNIVFMCRENVDSLRQLEGSFNNPGAREKIMDYQSVLSAPFERLMNPATWKGNNALGLQEADSIIDVHLNEINEYLDLLLKE